MSKSNFTILGVCTLLGQAAEKTNLVKRSLVSLANDQTLNTQDIHHAIEQATGLLDPVGLNLEDSIGILNKLAVIYGVDSVPDKPTSANDPEETVSGLLGEIDKDVDRAKSIITALISNDHHQDLAPSVLAANLGSIETVLESIEHTVEKVDQTYTEERDSGLKASSDAQGQCGASSPQPGLEETQKQWDGAIEFNTTLGAIARLGSLVFETQYIDGLVEPEEHICSMGHAIHKLADGLTAQHYREQVDPLDTRLESLRGREGGVR